MRRSWVAVCVWMVVGLTCSWATADEAVTNWDLQAVDATGAPSNPLVGGEDRVIVEGICLNNPEDMLNPAQQWQVVIQGQGTDLGGTAAWAGTFYQGSIWASELARLNGSGFREGDLIRLVGYSSGVGGKSNINERHSAAPEMDFSVELVQAGVGLPSPALTTIGAMNTFDATRQSGGELYQCRRIRLEHVSLQAGGTWASNTVLTITDPNDPNQTLPLRLCNVNFGTQAPNTWFNIVGLGDQESSNTSGYQVWVTRRNGIEVPGDCNLDGMVSTGDLSLLAGSWGKTSGATWAQGDFNGDGIVGTGDLSLLAGNWQYGVAAAPAPEISVPEPATMALLGLGGLALVKRKSNR